MSTRFRTGVEEDGRQTAQVEIASDDRQMFAEGIRDENLDPACGKIDQVGAEGCSQAEQALPMILPEVEQVRNPTPVAVIAKALDFLIPGEGKRLERFPQVERGTQHFVEGELLENRSARKGGRDGNGPQGSQLLLPNAQRSE